MLCQRCSLLKAAGETGALWMTDVCNAVVKDGKIPEDWSRSWMVNVHKGKGDALACGSYRGIKLLEHAMRVLERVIETRVRKIVKMDGMQFGFMAGRSTTDAIFIVRQLQEKYLAKNKELWMAFVDLEKAFDRVPREVVWWALRYLGVDEWIVSVIKAMYEDATMRLNGRESNASSVRVGVHQGSVLSPLLFIIVLEALSREFREGLPIELLYADDLVLMAESEELLMEKLRKWKTGMEGKGLRVNAGKTKVMQCRVSRFQSEDSGEHPCGVRRKGVGNNSISCVKCLKWVHKRCSGISGKLKSNVDFHCRRWLEDENGLFQSVLLKEVVIEPNVKLECVPNFRYLGDTLGAGGGVEEAARARVRCAWAKFKEISPILTARSASYHMKGKIYKACVQSVLTYGTETWAMKIANLQSLERTERMMMRWMCGVSLKDRKRSVDLYSLLKVQSVAEVVRRGRLRWFGHVERKGGDDLVSACRNVVVAGVRCAGKGRETWRECVRDDMEELGLHPEWVVFRDMWRNIISGKTSDPS